MEIIDPVIKETVTLTLQYELEINTDTGELLSTKLIHKSVDKSNVKVSSLKQSKVPDNGQPMLILEDNKLILNDSAIKLLEISSGDKVDIRYDGGTGNPLLCVGVGNSLTKNNTVSYRGKKNAELAKFGNEFNVEHYKDTLYWLKSTTAVVQKNGDENISIEEEDIPFDLSLDNSENVTEIDSTFFQL